VAGRPREFDRDAVLEQAMLLFWRKGYEATSLSDITAAADIGRQSLYATFGDKESLFSECLDRYTDLLERELSSVLEAEGAALDNFARFFDAAESQTIGAKFQGCLLGNTLAELGLKDSKLDRVLRRKVERVRAVYERTLLRAERRGELKAGSNVAALARSLTAFTQGAALLCRVWREPEAIRETLAGARALLDAHDARKG
jgi:TetR/AcrR family transcriptional regulator, transcriptional repressor for nem operon